MLSGKYVKGIFELYFILEIVTICPIFNNFVEINSHSISLEIKIKKNSCWTIFMVYLVSSCENVS